MSETTIDLDFLEKTTPLPQEELIYRNEFTQLWNDITQKVRKNVENARLGNSAPLHHPCFFINGGRGSGKSTLLRTLRTELCKPHQGEVRMGMLAAIDPTELADTENFFIHILGRIHRLMEEFSKSTKPHGRIGEYGQREACREVYASIQKMSKGLGLLVRKPEFLATSSDASFYVQESVDACVSGTELKKEFANLVSHLCCLLEIDALLVTVDDADMNFNKCSEVFETVRKYLLNPHMVFVFAGDLKLYTMVVRGMQLTHFGGLALKFDETRKEHRFELLDNLEDQYVMKLLPVGNRVELFDFSEVLRKEPYIKSEIQKLKKMPLSGYLETELPKHLNGCSPDVYKPFIQTLTVRSALQLLSYWVRNISKKNVNDNLMVMWKGIRLVTSHAIIKHQVDDNSIFYGSEKELAMAVLKHVKDLNAGIGGACFLPAVGSSSLQMVSFYLSAAFAWKVKTLKNLLAFILYVYPVLQGKIHSHWSELAQSFLNMRMFSTRMWGAYCTSLMRASAQQQPEGRVPYGNGVIPLFLHDWKATAPSMSRDSVETTVANLVERVESRGSLNDMLFVLALCHSMNQEQFMGQNVFYLSVYNLFSCIMELLSVKMSKPISKGKIRDILSPANAVPLLVRETAKGNEEVSDPQKKGDSSIRSLFTGLSKGKNASVFEKAVDSVYKWLTELKDDPGMTQVNQLGEQWQSYYQSCLVATNEAPLKAWMECDVVSAGDLFIRYVSAFIEHLIPDNQKNESRKKNKELVDCPLVQALMDDSDEEGCLELLNQVNVGPVDLFYNAQVYVLRWADLVRQYSEDSKMRIEYEFYKSSAQCESRYENLLAREVDTACSVYAASLAENENEEERAALIGTYRKAMDDLRGRSMGKMKGDVRELCDMKLARLDGRIDRETHAFIRMASERIKQSADADEAEKVLDRYRGELRFRINRIISGEAESMVNEYMEKAENEIRASIQKEHQRLLMNSDKDQTGMDG